MPPPECPYCKSPVAPERIDLGYRHCMADDCVASWRRERQEAEFRLHLLPKQGYVITKKEVTVTGRSSGR